MQDNKQLTLFFGFLWIYYCDKTRTVLTVFSSPLRLLEKQKHKINLKVLSEYLYGLSQQIGFWGLWWITERVPLIKEFVFCWEARHIDGMKRNIQIWYLLKLPWGATELNVIKLFVDEKASICCRGLSLSGDLMCSLLDPQVY